MPIADALKTKTAEQHRYAETRPLQKELAAGGASKHQLALYLAQLKRIHETLESIMAGSSTESHRELIGLCAQHSRRIQADLTVLDEASTVLESTQKLIDVLLEQANAKPAFVVGSMYVLEGSMNGNRFIARGLARGLDLEPGQPGLMYWDPYGEDQRARWVAVRAAIDNMVLSPADEQAILDGAAFMFDAVAQVSETVGEATGITTGV